MSIQVQYRTDEYAGQMDGGEQVEIGHLKVDGKTYRFWSEEERDDMERNYRCHGTAYDCICEKGGIHTKELIVLLEIIEAKAKG